MRGRLVRRERRSLHTLAYVSIRQHSSAFVSIRQHITALVSIRQHTSACVSIRIQHTLSAASARLFCSAWISFSATLPAAPAEDLYSCIRQHTSALYSCIRQHTLAYVSIRRSLPRLPRTCTPAHVSKLLHTSANSCIRQHTSAYVGMYCHACRGLVLLHRGFEARELRLKSTLIEPGQRLKSTVIQPEQGLNRAPALIAVPAACSQRRASPFQAGPRAPLLLLY